MGETFISIRVEKNQAAHRQITRQLKEEILSQKLPAGMQLPATGKLAEMWGVSAYTVHTALTPLVKAGLLIRQNGRGVFVSERKKKLCAAIYYGSVFWDRDTMGFSRQLHDKICAKLTSLGFDYRIIPDTRPDVDQITPLEELAHWIENGEVHCIIAPSTTYNGIQWLEKMSVPAVISNSGPVKAKVGTRLSQFIEVSLENLKSQGCRSVGFITSLHLVNEFGKDTDAKKDFISIARRLGLEADPSWLEGRHLDSPVRKSPEEIGYDLSLGILTKSHRPEGMVVYPDSAARGVTLGIVQADVKVPEQLKLVFHRNEELQLFCPFPVTWVTSNISEFASAFCESILHQLKGESPREFIVPFRIQVQ